MGFQSPHPSEAMADASPASDTTAQAPLSIPGGITFTPGPGPNADPHRVTFTPGDATHGTNGASS
jgi:hypothetical protein